MVRVQPRTFTVVVGPAFICRGNLLRALAAIVLAAWLFAAIRRASFRFLVHFASQISQQFRVMLRCGKTSSKASHPQVPCGRYGS
jgi:hypothetical protein